MSHALIKCEHQIAPVTLTVWKPPTASSAAPVVATSANGILNCLIAAELPRLSAGAQVLSWTSS